jgi:hypothetical protein
MSTTKLTRRDLLKLGTAGAAALGATPVILDTDILASGKKACPVCESGGCCITQSGDLASQQAAIVIFASSSFTRFLSSCGPSTLALLPQPSTHRVLWQAGQIGLELDHCACLGVGGWLCGSFDTGRN